MDYVFEWHLDLIVEWPKTRDPANDGVETLWMKLYGCVFSFELSEQLHLESMFTCHDHPILFVSSSMSGFGMNRNQAFGMNNSLSSNIFNGTG